MRKNSKRGLRIIAGISTVILMSPLFANSSVQVMLGNELNAHADTNAKTPEGDKSVHKAFTPKRKSQHAVDSSVTYSHKVPVLKVSLKPTSVNYFKKGDQIHFKFSSKNVNLKNLKASYQKSLPFSYKKVNDHELVLTFKKSLNSGLYGQAYAIPTKNKKMTTKVSGTFDNAKLDIKNGNIHSYKLTSKAHKASSNAESQQNTANQESTSNATTQQQQSTSTSSQATNNTGTTTGTQQTATSNSGTTTGTQQTASSQQAQQSSTTNVTTSSSKQSSASQSASTSGNQSYVSTQGKAVAKTSTGGTTSTEANQPQASKVDSSSTASAQTTDATSSSDQTQAQSQSTSTSSDQTTTQASDTTADSSADSQAASTDNSNVTTNSDGSISQSQQQNVSATDAYNAALSRTTIKQGSSTKGYVSTPVPSASDPETTYNKYAQQDTTSTTGSTSDSTTNSSTSSTTTATDSTNTDSTNQSSQTSTTPTTAQANSTGTVSTAADSQTTSTATDTTTTADGTNTSEENSEGSAIYNAVKKNVSDQTSTWASANEQGEIIKEYPWILKDISSKMAANQDTKGQVWKYAVPLTTGKTVLVTIDGRSSKSKADEGTLAASMPSLLKSLGSSSKTGMFDEAVDIDVLKQSDYYKNLQTEQNNLKNASAKDAYNAVLSSTTFFQDNGTLDTSKYTVAPTPDASDPEATYAKLAADQSSSSNSSTSTTEDSDSTAIFNNIKLQVANQTKSWANSIEQGEIIKDYPWILNDIAKKMAVAGADDNQVWNYKILLTTGKTALVTINGQADATNPSSLTASMPQLLKSLGSSATPGMFDDAVDSDVLKNSQYYKDLQEQSDEQAHASTSSNTSSSTSSTTSDSGIFGSLLSSIVSSISFISGLTSTVQTVATIGALSVIPVVVSVASVISSAVSSVTNIINTTNSIVSIAQKIAPIVAPLFIIPAITTIAGIVLNLPLIVLGLTIAKPVLDTIGTVMTISGIVTAFNTVNTIGKIVSTVGTIGSAIVLGTTIGAIGTAVAVGALLSTVLPVIFNTISGIANAVSFLSKAVAFVSGMVLGTVNALTSAVSILGKVIFALPTLGTVSSLFNTVLSVAGSIAFSVLAGTLANSSTGFSNVPLLAGFAIGASLVSLILTELGRQLINSVTSAINKFIESAKNVMNILALGSIIPAFVLAPTLIKIAMAFLALIPLAGWALKKFFDNIKAGLNTLKQFINGVVITLPLTAINTAIASTVTSIVNNAGSLVSTTLGPLAVRLVVGALTLATLPITFMLIGLPFVFINIVNRLFKDLVTGTVKLVADVASLAANVVTNIENQIQQVIKTVVSPVVNGVNFLSSLLFIIPALTGIKYLTFPLAAIISLPLSVIANILVPGLATNVAKVVIPAITGLLFIPTLAANIAGGRVLTYFLGLPVALILGNALGNLLGQIIGSLTTALRNGVHGIINLLISPLSFISNILGLIPVVNILTLPLRIATSILTIGNNIAQVINPIVDAVTGGLNSLVARLLFAPVALVGELFFGLPTIVNLAGLPILITSIGKTISSLSSLNTKIIDWMTSAIQNALKSLTFNTIFNQALQSLIGLPVLLLTSPIWVGLPLATLFINTLGNVIVPLLKFVNNSILLPALQLLTKIAAPIIADVLTFIPQLMAFANSLKTAFTTFFTVAVPQLIGAFVLPQILINGLSLLGGTINTLVQMIGVGISSFVNKLLFNIANGIISLVLNAASLLTTLDGLGNLANAVSGLLFGIPALLALLSAGSLLSLPLTFAITSLINSFITKVVLPLISSLITNPLAIILSTIGNTISDLIKLSNPLLAVLLFLPTLLINAVKSLIGNNLLSSIINGLGNLLTSLSYIPLILSGLLNGLLLGFLALTQPLWIGLPLLNLLRVIASDVVLPILSLINTLSLPATLISTLWNVFVAPLLKTLPAQIISGLIFTILGLPLGILGSVAGAIFGSILPQIIAGVLSFLTSLPASLLSGILSAISTISNVLGTIGDFISGLSALGNVILNVLGNLLNPLNLLNSTFIKGFITLAGDIGRFLSDILFKLPVQALLNSVLPALVQFGTSLIMPVISGLVGLPISMFISTIFSRLVSSLLNLPLLLLGNDLLSWLPALLAGAIVQLGSLLKNGLPTILGAMILFGLPAVLLPLEILTSLLMSLLLPTGLKWLAALPIIIPALLTIGSQIKWVIDAISAVFNTIISTIKAVISNHEFLVNITTIPTIIGAVLNTVFNNSIGNLISDFLSTLGKLNWNNFVTPIIVSGIAKNIAAVLTNILNFIGNIVNTIISNILKGLFNLQGISGLLGLLFDIPAAILQGILNNIIPDIVGAIAGLLAFAFNLLISTPLMLLGMIASALGRLVLTTLLNPILQFGIDLISWIPALLLGTLVNIFNLINGLLTQGPIGLLLFGLPLLLNLGLLFANLLAIPGFILNLIGNLLGLQNILSTIFPLIAAILLGAGLTIVSGITNGLNIVSLAGQLLLSILTAPLWIGIPALNLIRQITFWTTALLGLPQAILSFLGTIASSILKSIWTGLTSLPQQLLNLALSLLSDIFNTIVKDALSAIGAGITGLLVLGGLNLAGNVIKTLLQLAQFFLVTLPLTIGGLIFSILALSLINSLIVSGLKSLLNSFLNGLVSTITSVLSALPGLASQFIANTIGTFALAAVLTLDLFTGLQKLGNRLVMSFILGFLNLLNSAVKAVAGLPTLLGVLGTIVAAILPVPGHLLIAALLGALTLGSLIAQLAELPLSLLIDALTFINNINNVLSIVSAIASLIGALVISQIVSGIAKLLLTPLTWLAGLITGLIGTVLNAIKGVIETVVPIVLGVIGSILSIAVPVAALIFNTIASILKDNPLLALLVFALPGLIIPALDAAMLSRALSAISGILKALWNLLTNPIGTILDIISSILNPFSSANIFKTILGILATLAALPVVIGLAKILSSIQNLINGPLQFIENLIGTVLSSIASGLIRLISNGLSLAGLKLLTDLLPKALLALFTLLVPVVNIFTIGSAITAALNDIPLAIIEKLASDLIASLIGNLVTGLLNVLGDLVSAIATFVGLFTVFLPLAGILVLTLVPASLILLWFFGPIVLQLMVNPIADLVAFMVLQYTMFNHTIFYLAFFWIFEPLTFLTFIGSFVNWLNPLNELFNGISSFAKNILPTLTNLGFTVIDLVALNTFLKGGVVGLQGALTLIGAALGLKLLIGIYSIANLIPVIGLWLVVIPLVLVIVVIGVLGVIANLGINVPTFLSFEIAVPFVTALAIFVTLVGMQIALMIDGLTTSIFLPGIVQNLASGLFTSFLTDPIFTLLANFAFASLGFASLLALPAGLIMLAHDWLPNTFNIPTFIYFLIMTSPIWTVGNWDGLFPIIGWIPAIIDDIGYFLIGAWGTGLITSLNFSLWLLTNIPLVFSVVVPIAMLLALGSTAFLLAPVGLIGGALISLVNAIGPVINAITSFIGSLVTGISAVIILVWFLAPIVLQLMVNPIADLVAFMILQYTMFNHTIFYLSFFYITEPLTFLTFVGSFTNWLNPLNSLFNGISSFAKNSLSFLRNAGLTLLSGLAWNTLLKGGLLGLAGFLLLGSASLDLQGLITLFGLNTLIPNLMLWAVAILWVGLLVIVGVLGVVANLGINVPTYLTFELAVPAATMLAITVALIGMVGMLSIDISTILTAVPGIVTKLGLGSLIALVSDPIFTVLTQAGFAVIGFASIVALIAGGFMLAEDWLPSTFNIPTFLFYLIMTSPIWIVGNWDGLVPIIGWIPAIIADIGYMLIGAWGTGLLTVLNFTTWLTTSLPLVFSTVVGISLLLSLGLGGLILAPIGLIGGAVVSLVNAIGPVINAITSFIGSLVTGISAVIILVWFLAPIVLQLMVNPIADFVAFMILQYTMFNHTIFYLSFFYITEPLTFLTFVGSFTNWLNPLNSLFNGISSFAKNSLSFLRNAGLTLLGGLAWNTLLKGGLLGLAGFLLLGSASLDLQGLITLFGLNTLIPNLMLWAVAILWVGLLVIVGVLGVVANLGINVPTYLTFELAVPAATMLAITVALIGMVGMLSIDISTILTAVPGIVTKLGLGSLIALVSDPIFTVLTQAGFAVIGFASIVALIAGGFMLAEDWLPSTFNIPTFLFYLIMTSPIWTVGNWDGLVPIIGWIPAIIADIGYMLIGAWGTGLLTVLNFTTWLTTSLPLVFSTVVGISLLLSLGLGGLILAPIGLIGGAVASLVNAIGPVINAITSFIGSLVTGISAVIILVWFLAPIVLQLMVNPIADLVAFMILQYTMFNHTIFYLSFFYITEPLTFLTFVGSFTNWLNPLNSLFNGISSFAKNSLSFLRNAGLTLLSGLAWNTLLKGGLLGLAGFLLLGSASLDLQGLITLFGLNTLIPNLMLWAVAILWVGLLVIVGVLGVVANLGINVPTYLTFELAVPAATMLAITVALIGMVGMLSIDISTILTAVPGIVTKLGLGSLIALVSDPIFTVLTQAGFAVIGFASIVALIAGGFMLAEDWLPSTFNIPTFLFYLIMTSPIWTVGNWDGLVPIIGWIPAIIADIGYMLIGAWGTGLLTVLNFTTWLTTSLPLVFSTVVGISLLLSLGLGGLILAPIGLIGGAVVSLVNAVQPIISAVTSFFGSIINGLAATLTLVWFLAPIVLQLMVNPIADFTAFMILLYTMFNHPIFYLSFFYISEPLTILTFIGTFTNLANPVNWVFNGISFFSKVALPITEFVAFVIAAGIGINTILKGGLLGLVGGFSILGALADLIGLSIGYTLNTLIPNLTLWAVAILWVGLFVIVGVLGVVANLGINVPTWFVYELGVPAGTMLAITLTMVAIVAMLVLDVNALLTALPGVVLKLGFGMISSFFVDPIFTSLGALGLAVTGVVSLIATLAGAFMLAQDWLPSTFNIPTFIFWLIMTNPAWIIGHFTGLIPIIGWIPAIIADIGSFLIGAWGTGLLTVLNFTTWLTSNVPLVLSGIGPILFLVATGLALPLITPFLVVLAIGLLIIPYFLIIPITNPNMIPTLLFAGLVKALTGVVSTIIGDIVSALVKMFNSFPLDNLLVSLLTKRIGSPEGLLQTILSLPLTALKAILQLASGINVALSVIWGIGDLLRSVFGSLIPSVILGALGNLLGIGNLLSDILNTLAILSIANILNAINPLNWLLNGLVTLGLSVASSIVNGIKTALDNIGSLLSNLIQLVLPILNLVRLIGIAAAGFELVGSLIDLLTTPLKMFFDFIKNVVLPFLAISTIANIITTALRLLSMPLLLLAIPLLTLLLSGSIINALASLLTPLAILAIAAALPYLLNALSGLLNLVPDILNLIATGLTNGIINLLKSLAVNNGLLKSLLSFVQSLINGGSWITNMFDKVIQLASDILGPLAAPLLLLLKGLGDLIGTVLPILGLIGSLLLPIPIVNVLLAFSFLPDALGALLGIASRIGDLLKSLGNMILIPIASIILAGIGLLLSPILSSIISPIVKLLLTLPVIGGLIALLANVASALSKNIWTLLGKLASTLINNILNAIFTEIPTLLSSFLNVLAKAGQLLLIALPDILIPTLSSQLSTMFLNGLSTVFKSITGLPYNLFIQPIINSIVNTIAPIVAFLALSLLNLVLSPIKVIFTVLKSIIDTINSQTALNKILQNIVNSVTSVLKGLQTLWLIGLALGSLVSSLISKAVADLTHLITSKIGQLLLNLAGLGYIIFGSNPLNSIGTIISNVGKMWTTSQIVPLVLKGIVQGLMKIGSTFTYFIRGIKHLGDLLVGFAIAPGALGVLGLVNQFIQKAVAAPFQWLFNNILVPLLASALTSSILRFIGPIALLVNLVLSLPGNTFGRLLVAIPLALLSNNIAQWLPAVALAVLGTLLPGLLSNAINLGVQGLPIFGLLVPAILGSIIKGLLIPSSLKWIANLPGLLGQIGSWLLLPLGLKWLAFVPDLIFSAAQNWFNSLLLNTIGTLLLSTLAVNIVRALSKGLGTLITFGLILPGIVFGSNPLEFISLLLKNINFLNGLNKVVPTIISGLLKAIMTISSIAQFIGDLIHNAIDTLLLIVTAPIWLVIPVMNGLSQLSKFANAVLSFVGTLIKNGFSDSIRNIISNLVSGLAGLLANVFKLLISPITNLINGITKLFAFTNWLQNSLNGIFLPLTIANAIGSLVRNAISFLNGLQGLFKLAGSLIYGTALGILQNLLNQSFLGKVLSLLLSGLAFFIPAITGITGLFNTLKNIVGNILKGLINLILSPITALINFIANQLFSGLLTNILKFIYGVQSFFENLPNSLFYVFGLLLPQLLGLLNPLTAGISMLLLPLTLLLGLPMTIGSIITNLVNNALASLIGHLVPTLLNILGNLISGLFNSPLLPIVLPLLKGLNSLIGGLYNTLTAPIEWIKGLIKTFFNGLNNLFKSSPIATILGLILGGLGAFNSLGSLITKIIKPFQDANNFVTFLKGLISNGASLIMTLGAFGLVGINNAVLDLFKALITVPTLLANVINGLLTPLFLSSALTGLKLLVTPAFMFLVEIPLANLINQLVPSIAKAILGLVVPLITSLGFLPTLLLTMAGNQIGFIFSSLPTVLWLTNALSSLIGNTVSFLTKVLNGIKRFITGLLTLPLNALMIGLAVINPLGSLVLAVSAAANALNKLPLTILGWIYDANTKNLSNAIKQFVTPILSTILGVLTYMGLLPLMNLINGIPNFVGSLISTIIPGILTNLIVPQIIGGLVGLVMPVLEFLNFINTALQSAFTLPLLLITAPLWIGLPLLTGIGNLISNVVVPVINFFNNNVLLPLQLLLNDLIANVAGSLLAGLVKLLTYPLAILNAITAVIPGLLLNTLINAATQFISFLNTIPGLISGIAGLLISPIINAIKAIATGLLTNTLNGILNGLNNLVELIDSITSVISTLTDQLIDGLSELINELVNVWKFGMVTVTLALLAGLLPEISVPDWLNNLLDSIIQTAQNVLNFGTSLLIGYLLIKTLAGSLLNNLVLPLILGGLLPLIITGFIQNGISKVVSGLLPLVLLPLLGLLLGSLLNNLVTNGLLSFLLPFLGGLLGAILGGLLNKNNNNNININININGLPLLLALIPLMSILNTIGNGVDLLFKLLGSILPGLIQLLLGGNKVIIVPIILPIIIPLIIPLLLGALLPILLPIILAALLPVILPILIPILLILPIIVWGLPVLIGLIGLLPILIGIPFIISILIPLIIPIIGIGILIGLGSLIFGGTKNTGTINISTIPSSPVIPDGTVNIPGLPNGSTNNGGTSQVPSTGNNVGGNSQTPSTPSTNNGYNGNGNSSTNSVPAQSSKPSASGLTTPTSGLYAPKSMTNATGLNAQKKLPQTNENDGNQVLTVILGLFLMLIDLLGYVWISHRRKFSMN